MTEPNKQHGRTNLSKGFRLLVPVSFALAGGILYAGGYRFDHLSAGLTSFGPWAPCLFGLLGVVAMSMMVPKTVVSLSAGALLGTHLGCLTMFFTAITAAAINYGIGRFWIARPERSPVSHPEFQQHATSPIPVRIALMQLARQAGLGLHLLMRLTPVPTSVISYSMGATQARFFPFLGAAAIGVVPQFLYVHAASLVTEPGVSQRYRYTSAAISLATALIVSIVLPKIALKHIRLIRDTDSDSKHAFVKSGEVN